MVHGCCCSPPTGARGVRGSGGNHCVHVHEAAAAREKRPSVLRGIDPLQAALCRYYTRGNRAQADLLVAHISGQHIRQGVLDIACSRPEGIDRPSRVRLCD